MNYYIEWQLYSSKDLIIPHYEEKEIMLFKWFYINSEWSNVFKSPLKNYFKYNFKFYFNNLTKNEKETKFVIQDNIEIELNFYCLIKDVSLISWIDNIIKEYKKNDKKFHNIWYIINEKFCWNYKKRNKTLSYDKVYDYKFRLSNLMIPPVDNSNINIHWIDYYFNKNFCLNLEDEEILIQLHYYNNWLFLEKNWFMSDAFNYFYKIIEIEEEKLWKVNIVNKNDLELKIEEFKNSLDESKKNINLGIFYQKIWELKLEKANDIREKIFKKYDLKWELKDFKKLWQIRWKFSHKWDISYVYLFDFFKCKKFTFDIIIKKITLYSKE